MTDRPYVSFAEVKEKVPIPEALEALGIADQFRRKGDSLSGICPLHAHGPRPNPEQFKISRRDGVWLWHCFGDCKRGGDVVELVKGITGFDNAHVRFWFADHFGDRLNLKKPGRSKKADESDATKKEACGDEGQNNRQQDLPYAPSSVPTEPAVLKPLRFFLNLDPDVPYLRERGLTEETIARFGLGLCRRGMLKGYLAIPIYGHPHTPGENPLGYLGRWPGEDYDVDKGRPRYRWPDGFSKSRVVYGLSLALETPPDRPLIVVESPFSVFHFFQAGLPNTVSIFGSSLSEEQADILICTGRPLILMFDGDEAGFKGMRTAAAKLIRHAFVRVDELPEGVQPDQIEPSAIPDLLC